MKERFAVKIIVHYTNVSPERQETKETVFGPFGHKNRGVHGPVKGFFGCFGNEIPPRPVVLPKIRMHPAYMAPGTGQEALM